jgi:hypothetical protein
METVSLNKTARVVSMKIKVRELEAQMQRV